MRHIDTPSALAIAACVRVVYFVDREGSLNFKTDQDLLDLKILINSTPILTTFIPLFLMFMLENKMNRHHNFAKLHAFMSHSLTAMIGVYYYI